MPCLRHLPAAFVFCLLAVPAVAADAPHRACLNKAEQRAAVANRLAVPLAQVIKSLHDRGRRPEIVRARLCHRGDGLVYVLTLLARNGKVTRATVNAANGEVIEGR